jgi:hypothetical protein
MASSIFLGTAAAHLVGLLLARPPLLWINATARNRRRRRTARAVAAAA